MMLALNANAQRPQLTDRLNQSGQVVVDAPQELAKRNNADLNKNAASKDVKAKDNKNADKKKSEVNKGDDKDEKLNELDDDKDTPDEKKDKDKDKDEKKKDETTTTVKPKPKRNYTTQQTIQKRSVGYRIQAYSDNNFRTAKANAQQRARDIAMKFPQYRSYISYKAPSWRLRIGDFQSQREAHAALSKIKSVFPKFAREMVIVRDHINVWSND